jgi:nicotinate dehydrogenase subunit B
MTMEMSRRGFLAGVGSLAVGFTFLRSGIATAADPTGLLRVNPSNPAAPTEAWLVLRPEGITVYSGKVELGTGVQTALSQIVVEELRLDVADVHYVQGDTERAPNQGGTVGSKTVQNGGPELRRAAATAYQALLGMAEHHLGVDRSQLVAGDARFRVRGSDDQSVSYRELLGQAETVLVADAAAPTVAPADYTVVGKDEPRVDIPPKVLAQFRYTSDIYLPGMLHARVIRPSGRNATFNQVVNLAQAQAIPGFKQVVQIGNFVAVVAETEWAAARAAAPATGITVQWNAGPPMIPFATLDQGLRDPANHYRSLTEVNRGDVDAAFAGADPDEVVEAQYYTPFQMHGSMGASAAVADVRTQPDAGGFRATVWSGTQNVTALRGVIARLLTTGDASFANNPLKVHVIYEEASGCYGHNGADDCAADAALISQAVGAPIRLQWTRQNEHGWEPLGAAQAHDMKGAVDEVGIAAWQHRVYAPTANSRPAANNAGTLLTGQHARGLMPANLPGNAGNSSGRNAPVIYAFDNQRVESRLVKSFNTTGPTSAAPSAPLTHLIPRTTALRSLGGFSNSFANESFFDELAAAGGQDPLELRIASLDDPRAAAVCEALRPAWAERPAGGDGVGAGVAFQQYEIENAYAATYVEVTVDESTGVIRVTRAVVAHDCGLVINPDGLRNQIEGNVIQGISRTLKEEVVYTGDHVTTTVWQAAPPFNLPPQYEVARFNDVPAIECILIDRPDEPALGAGEPTIGTLGGAIANAVFAAVGARVRRLPMTPERVLAALAA